MAARPPRLRKMSRGSMLAALAQNALRSMLVCRPPFLASCLRFVSSSIWKKCLAAASIERPVTASFSIARVCFVFSGSTWRTSARSRRLSITARIVSSPPEAKIKSATSPTRRRTVLFDAGAPPAAAPSFSSAAFTLPCLRSWPTSRKTERSSVPFFSRVTTRGFLASGAAVRSCTSRCCAASSCSCAELAAAFTQPSNSIRLWIPAPVRAK